MFSSRIASFIASATNVLGTPIGPGGQSDLSQLHDALRALEPVLDPATPLVVRSTLPPGSTRLAVEWSGAPTSRVFTNPEFLRQGTALADFRSPTRIVLGRFPDADPDCQARVEALFADTRPVKRCEFRLRVFFPMAARAWVIAPMPPITRP